MKELKFNYQQREEQKFPSSATAKVMLINDIAQVIYSQNSDKCTALSSIKRISASEYINTETGEVFKYSTNSSKADNTASIKESLKKVRLLIYNNFKEYESFFITLTYRDEMKDFQQAVNDFRCFYDKLNYRFSDYQLEYLRIIEPTDEGVWHIHILLKNSDNQRLVITKCKVDDLWTYGSIDIKQINDVNGIAKYLTTYHSNIENEKRLSKTMRKQTRWRYYPCRARIYAKSKGIVYPETKRIDVNDVSSYLIGYKMKDSKVLEISDKESGIILNRVKYESYEKE